MNSSFPPQYDCCDFKYDDIILKVEVQELKRSYSNESSARRQGIISHIPG